MLLCFTLAAAATKAAPLGSATARGVTTASLLVSLGRHLFCLCPDFPKTTQRWRLHPNSKSQYSSLTTSLSSLSPFSGAYCLSLSLPNTAQCLTRQGFLLFQASNVHLLFLNKECFKTAKSSIRRLQFALKPNQSRHKINVMFSVTVFHD